jgi:hypothetical protein
LIRKYVNFLDGKFGRGVFMIFVATLILEDGPVEIVIFVFVCIIGIINMLIGCKQGSDAKKAA